MHGDELRYMMEAYETNWMSTVGANINEVERIAAEKAEVKYAVALATDLEYIQKVTFLGDVKIIFDTVKQVFFKEKGLGDSDVDEVDITDDFGDYLLKVGRVSQEEYDEKQAEAAF